MLQLNGYRAVLPAFDLIESVSFYGDLGFRHRSLDVGVVELTNRGTSAFVLKAVSPTTRFEAPIMVAAVPSLSDWWIRIKLLDLGRHHKVKPPREPVPVPRGQTTGYLYDPCGTTWQFVETSQVPDRRFDQGLDHAPFERPSNAYFDEGQRGVLTFGAMSSPNAQRDLAPSRANVSAASCHWPNGNLGQSLM